MAFELDSASGAFALAIVFFAYMVRGIVGFGSALVAVPLLALMFPLQIAVPVVVFLDYIGSASQGLSNLRLVAWRDQLPLIPFTFVGVGIGLFLFQTLDSADLAQALGGFIIVYAFYQLLPLPDLRGPRLMAVPCGILGGLLGALFGTGGPFYVIYLGLRRLEKSIFRATFAVNFLIDGAIRLVAYAVFGFVSADLMIAMVAALPIAGLALWTGGRVHAEMSQRTYTKLISLVLLGSGAMLLLKH
jgi:uncharacterized membrane protein YfcA